MRSIFGVCMSLSVLAAFVPSVQAHGLRHRHGCDNDCGPTCCQPCQPCAPAPVQYVEKKVTCYRPEWRTREVPCTVNRVIPREVVEQKKCTMMVPVYSQQKRTITVMTQVPRQVEREVTCCRMVPHCETDPCTGCTRTVCCPERYTQKVSCTVMQCVPTQREITVPVCNYQPQERSYEVRRVVCEVKPETTVRHERYCVMVPYEATVRVPVCPPAPCCQ